MSGWPSAFAEEDAGSLDASSVGELLSSLAEEILAAADAVTGRYRLLETVRDYARAMLSGADEAEEMRSRHLGYFVALAEEAESHLIGADQAAWLERLEREHDNLRSALEWSGEAGDGEQGLRLAGAVWRFWSVRSHFAEGRARLQSALSAATVAPSVRAKALNAGGALAWSQGDYLALEGLA